MALFPPDGVPCPFCHPERDEAQRVVLESAHARFLQAVAPEIEGAGIVVPRAHRETPFELTNEEWADTRRVLLDAKALLDRTLAPDGYTLGWNVGAVGGQHVAHAHLHVIPRFADEPLAGKGLRYAFKQPENRRLPKENRRPGR